MDRRSKAGYFLTSKISPFFSLISPGLDGEVFCFSRLNKDLTKYSKGLLDFEFYYYKNLY